MSAASHIKMGGLILLKQYTILRLTRLILLPPLRTHILACSLAKRTLIYHDQVFLNDQPVEDTRDYLAQQKSTGDVWYFGEEVNNYQNGQLKDHRGTFLHGTDGAKAGIWIKANQKVGDNYRQEYYKGHAEDMLRVVAINQTVKTKSATYTGCVELYAWTPIEDDKEYKYNCPAVSAEVLVRDLTEHKQSELISISQ